LITWRLDWHRLIPSLRYSLPLVALGFAYSLGTRIDRIVLERYFDLESLGAYAVLAGILALLTVVLDTLDSTIRPYLYPEMRSRGLSAHGSMGTHQNLYLFAGLLALSFAVSLGSNLHLVTTNPAYLSIREWLPLGATALTPVIAARWYALHYDFHKRSSALAFAVLARLVVLSVLLILLVPRAGIGGALVAILAAEVTNACVLGWTASRLFSMSVPVRPVLPIVAAFLGAIWLPWYAMGAVSTPGFGALQLVLTAALLAAASREALRVKS
jgi:O-antigen/teichoic acid export membrane protein